MQHILRHSLVRFALVGGIGFVVDAGILMLLLDTLGPYLGRVISFICAATTTWVLNRQFTFAGRQSGLSRRHEFTRYFGAMLLGGAVNYATYAALVALVSLVAAWPVLGVGAGSLAGMVVNFSLARFFIFSQKAETKHS